MVGKDLTHRQESKKPPEHSKREERESGKQLPQTIDDKNQQQDGSKGCRFKKGDSERKTIIRIIHREMKGEKH
jgi:hypothetical protein